MTAAHEAREALGLRLRELRRDADITGRALASLAGWHESKVSKIENGKQTPSEADLRTWCELTRSGDHLADLIATLRNLEAAYIEWRRILATGTRRRQKLAAKLEGEASLMRWYEPGIFPGLLQTPDYVTAILNACHAFYGTPDDLAEATAARIERQRVLYHGKHRFHFLVAEQALHTTVGDDEVMYGQLDRALAVMGLPRVVLGIVPSSAKYEGPVAPGFAVFDARMVQIETVSAELTVTQPREIALYEKMFAILAEQAVYGDGAPRPASRRDGSAGGRWASSPSFGRARLGIGLQFGGVEEHTPAVGASDEAPGPAKSVECAYGDRKLCGSFQPRVSDPYTGADDRRAHGRSVGSTQCVPLLGGALQIHQVVRPHQPDRVIRATGDVVRDLLVEPITVDGDAVVVDGLALSRAHDASGGSIGFATHSSRSRRHRSVST
nr:MULTISPECIES: helix-turn-helix transcriptional regulator [Nocardia]